MPRAAVLFRNLNQGQKRMPTTDQVRSSLEAGGASWVLTFQTNGTAVIDTTGDPRAVVASALARLAEEAGYADLAVVLDLASLRRAVEALPPPVTEAPDGMELYQDVLTFVVPADGLDLEVPWTSRHGDVVVHSVDRELGMVHATAFRRAGQISGNLTAELERPRARAAGVPAGSVPVGTVPVRATTRTRGTIERLLAKVDKVAPPAPEVSA